MTQGKAFFFEKKKQKTFAPGGGIGVRAGSADACAGRTSARRGAGGAAKVFSSFFSKKDCLLALLALAPTHALADAATRNNIEAVSATTGEGIYQHVCQGCHMPGAVGAIGAGRIPALAGNKRLAASGYPVAMVLRGNGGMPWFNGTLDDAQIATVVNYVRTHFGNDYKDAVTPAYVASVKGPVPVVEQ